MLKSILCSLIILFTVSSTFGQEKKASFSKEEAAIKEVIENESKFFWARDFKNWKKTWVQKPYIVWTAASQDGVRQYNGWKEWLAQVEGLFESSPEPTPYEGEVKKYNYKFRIYGKGAWVSFIQENHEVKTIETSII